MKRSFVLALLCVSTFLFLSCQSPLLTANVSEGEALDKAVTTPLAVSGHLYDKGAFNKNYTSYDSAFSDKTDDINVDISAWIVVNFNRPISTASLPASIDDTSKYPITVIRTRDNQFVFGTFELRNSNQTLVFRPAQRHFLEPMTGSEGTKTSWIGIKPATDYKITVAGLTDTSGGALTASATNTWTMKTVDVDWGLYFMSKKQADGYVYMEKYIPGRDNKYFIPSAKTMMYTHGYEKNASINDYRRENLMYFVTKGSGTIPLGFDTLQFIKDDGWNFGMFFWDQFADEPSEVKNAEAKIWNKTNSNNGIKYRVQLSPNKGEFRSTNQPIRSLSEEFFLTYVSALQNNTENKRILGHSTGAQLAVALAKRVSDAVTNGTISTNLLMNRLTMLEGFWSKDSKSYFKGVLGFTASMTNANAVVSIVTTLKARHPTLAIEQDKMQSYMCGDSTSFGISIGDANYNLRTLTCVTYTYPDFIGTSATADTGDRHCYGRLYYFWCYSPALTARFEGYGSVTSGSSDSRVVAAMNKTGSQYVFKMTAGKGSADPSDDVYSKVALVKY